MEKLLECFINIIIPIITSLLIAVITRIVNREKQWKRLKEKTVTQNYLEYYAKVLIMGGITIFVYVFIVWYFEKFLEISVSEIFFVIVYYLLILTVCATFGYYSKNIRIKFKRLYKRETQYIAIARKMPSIISGWVLGSVFVPKGNWFLGIALVFIIVTEIICMVILDDSDVYKYQYITFYFYNEKIIENIEVEKISQKNNWIVVSDENRGVEHRFRIKDIERVEYRNNKTSWE